MGGLGREEGPERETVDAEDEAHVQKRKAGRRSVGTGEALGDITINTEEMELRAACGWVRYEGSPLCPMVPQSTHCRVRALPLDTLPCLCD